MSECNHDCSSCASASTCGSKNTIEKEKPHKGSEIKNVIAVISGKGGVGKSLTTALLASVSNKKGNKTAVLDADLTGPSIPKIFGVKEHGTGDDDGLDPVITREGIKIMSVNLLLEDETAPVIWRGPVIAGVVKQFWTDVKWGEVDYMFVDCPPGTGDVPLTIFQSLPVKGIVVVTSPQDLVSVIVEKAVNMAKMMNVPVLGIVQNMSYFVCDSCNTKHYIYGKTDLKNTAEIFGIKNAVELPIMPSAAKKCDEGNISDLILPEMVEFFDKIVK